MNRWRVFVLQLQRLVLSLLGLVMLAFLVLLGLVMGLVIVVWALLRGRRPAPVRFGWKRGPNGMPRRAAPGPGAAPAGEVVDIQAREVAAPAPSLPRQPQ